MIYVMTTIETPRGRAKEYLEFWGKKVYPFDEENYGKAGARFVGMWYTEYPNPGEITVIVAFPSLDVRDKGWQAAYENEEWLKNATEWLGMTPKATLRVMKPASFSPEQ